MNTVIAKNDLRAEISGLGASVTKLCFRGIEVGKDGVTVGRYANRISGASFILDGKKYMLDANEGKNTLHGGKQSFKRIEWQIESSDSSYALLSLESPDGDQGFPGKLMTTVRYEITDNALVIDYTAVTDAPTVINLTNHLYFNLNGGGNVSEHMLQISSGKITETDGELIPTGRLTGVEGTRFDYRTIRDFEPSYDDNYVLDKADISFQAAELYGIRSGVRMKVFTDQPGMQLYNTATHICLETQHFADSPNRPEFPSTVLRPGETFRSGTVYKFEI